MKGNMMTLLINGLVAFNCAFEFNVNSATAIMTSVKAS
jgi:hypothetical protein